MKHSSMVLLRQYRSNLPCNLYLDDCGTYDKPTVFIQLTLHRTPLSDSSVITYCIQMTLDGDVDEEVHEHPENRLRVEILAKVSSFVKQNRAYIYSLWDCNDDYDFGDFAKDITPYDTSHDNLNKDMENKNDNKYE